MHFCCRTLKKKMRFFLSLILFSSVAFPVFAAEIRNPPKEGGRPIAVSETRRTVDGFGASVVITSDPNWESKWSSPGAEPPRFTPAETVAVGEQATMLIFFSNAAVDADGRADVTCDVRITRPGKGTEEHLDLKGFSDRLTGSRSDIYLTEAIIRFVAEPAEPLGEWVMDINVHDNVRQVSVPLRTRLLFVPVRSGKTPGMSEPELTEFMFRYYLHPTPEKVPDAIGSMRRMGVLNEGTAGTPISTFLSMVFRANPEILEPSLAGFSGYSLPEQQVLLQAVWLADTEETRLQLQQLLSLQSRKGIRDNAGLATRTPPGVDQVPVDSPEVVDALWGAFMATGDERYVVRVISVLPYVTAKGSVSKVLVGGAAKWSLKSNAVRHRRVLEICKAQLGKQPAAVRELLAEVISEARNCKDVADCAPAPQAPAAPDKEPTSPPAAGWHLP